METSNELGTIGTLYRDGNANHWKRRVVGLRSVRKFKYGIKKNLDELCKGPLLLYQKSTSGVPMKPKHAKGPLHHMIGQRLTALGAASLAVSWTK